MHVIVGQGQLDAVLSAGPEERRGFIEEAAGVLKHRKRKEKALRKLDAMQANLTRLQDLTVELRRQLKPLGRQAEVARRAAVIQADLRDARLRLLADDLVQLQRDPRGRGAPTRPRCGPGGPRSRRRWPRRGSARPSSSRRPRRRRRRWPAPRRPGTGCPRCASGCAAPRAWPPSGVRHLAGEPPEDERPGRDPEELEAEAAPGPRARSRQIEAAVARDREALAAAVTARAGGRGRAGRRAERGSPRLPRAAADRREGLARLAGQVAARRSRVEAGEAEIGRLTAALAEAARAGRRGRRRSSPRSSPRSPGSTRARRTSTPSTRRPPLRLAAAEEQVAALQDEERAAERERAALAWPRKDALELGLARKDGAGAAAGCRRPALRACSGRSPRC